MLPGMDFHKAFQAIDTDHSGEITVEELEDYCKKMNYKDTFVQKWLNLFDEDQSGTITYEEYCNTLGLIPKKELIEQHQAAEQESSAPKAAKASDSADSKGGRSDSKGGRSRNTVLSGSLMRYSRARMFQRKALYRIEKKRSRLSTSRSKSDATSSAVTSKEKAIGGDKNGGSRMVASSRMPKSLPTCASRKPARARTNKTFSQHKRKLRASIQPGTVLILLAGRHRGKRVVFLKQLDSGLLLVSGPLRLNGCPLRRIGQKFVIATKTRLQLQDVDLPERVNDQYFRRAKSAKKQADKGDIFQSERQSYQLSEERREDQRAVDKQIMSAIAGSEEKKLLIGYLRSLFSIGSGQRPHEMQF